MTNKNDNRPITVRIDELKKTLDTAIDKSHLPAFILELIWNQYLTSLHRIAMDEYNSEKERYFNMQEGEKDGRHQ